MSPERKRIDIDAIKASISLVEFARQYTTLKQISQRGAGEYAGACPCCGGEDRFHVRGDHFYCRQCYPRGGDIINFVQLLHSVSFVDACRMLTAGDFSFSEKLNVYPSQTERAEQAPAIDWQTASYQESARKTMFATHRLLESDEGTEGQAYLLSRGLIEATWRTYRLGYGRTFHPTRRKNLEAIFVPWFGEDGKTITAIQHRFLDSTLEKGERYALKPGSEPILFGL
jgi:DNA primase